MQRLDLNLATHPARNTTIVWSGYALASVLVAATTWANVSTYRDHRARGRELASQAGSFTKQQQDLEARVTRAQTAIRGYDVPALHVQAAKANEIIDWKAFSWTRLFNLMEHIQPGGVRMNTVRPVFYGAADTGDPRASGGAGWGLPVAVEGTARTLDDVAEFEQAIQDDPHFAFVLPEHLARSDSGEILFQLRFHYRPVVEPPKAEESRPKAGPVAGGETPETVRVDDPWDEVGAAGGTP